MAMRRSLWKLLLLAVALHPISLFSQTGSDSLTATRASNSGVASTALVVAPRVLARSGGTGFQVAEIALPDFIPPSQPVGYEIEPSGESKVLSGSRGVLDANLSAPSRSILVTFKISNGLPSGIHSVAKVRFFEAGGRVVEVPLEIEVPAVHSVRILTGEVLRAVRLGARFSLTYTIVNDGNARDTLEIVPQLPRSWKPVGSPAAAVQRVALEPGERREFDLNVGVGTDGPTGVLALTLTAIRGGVEAARGSVRVEVLDRFDRAPREGPRVNTSLATGSGVGIGADPITAVTTNIEGKLTDSIEISGRFSTLNGGSTSLGLTRLGIYRLPPMLALRGSTWSAALGATGSAFSDLTGISLAGTGFSGSLANGNTRYQATLARPDYGTGKSDGVLAGGRWDIGALGGRIGAVVSHLDETHGQRRQLDAVGVAAAGIPIWGGEFGAEVAGRRFDRGEGIGYALSFRKQGNRDNLAVRLVSSPGGSQAFARSNREIWVSGGRRLNHRVTTFGSLWRSSDTRSGSFEEISNSGWTVGANLELTAGLEIGTSLQDSRFTAATDITRFGNSETGVSFRATHRGSILLVSTDATLSSITSLTGIGAMPDFVEHGSRKVFRSEVGINTSRGSIELLGRLEQNSRGLGQLPEQLELGVTADDFALIQGPGFAVRVGGSVRRYFFPGLLPPRTTATGLFSVDLMNGTTVSVSAERNPFLIGQTPWIYAFRVDRSTWLPRLKTLGAKGMVFLDRNANGAHDRGEPGVSGVVLRRGNDIALTDEQGEFGFESSSVEPVVLDQLSLSKGVILGESRGGKRQLQFAVVPVENVEVLLRVADAGGRALNPEILSPVMVSARGADGRVWMARRIDLDHAVFEALPPGEYSIVVDTRASEEPLEVVSSPGILRIDDIDPRFKAEVVLRPRPVTVRQFGTKETQRQENR